MRSHRVPKAIESVEARHVGDRLQVADASHGWAVALLLRGNYRDQERGASRVRRAFDAAGTRERMKLVADRPFADPDLAARRKLVEIANG